MFCLVVLLLIHEIFAQSLSENELELWMSYQKKRGKIYTSAEEQFRDQNDFVSDLHRAFLNQYDESGLPVMDTDNYGKHLPDNFSKKAWQRDLVLFESILKTQFIQGVISGQLDDSRFLNYLLQDSLYLQSNTRLMAIGAAKSDNSVDKALFSSMSQSSAACEMEIPERRIQKTSPMNACKQYTDFLNNLAFGELSILTAALQPCRVSYKFLASHIFPKMLPSNKFFQWAKSMYSPDYTIDTDLFSCMTDRLAQTSNIDTLYHMNKAYDDAMKFELEFWQASFNI
uniref:Thiaminase-2/PQQC domain-containing protein n=1 Tax=Ditylenchus dipsaci TaxID=166011 RepID=A0A915DG59_9BILA